MRTLPVIITLTLVSTPIAAWGGGGGALRETFDTVAPGKLPAALKVVRGDWKVVVDANAPSGEHVLAQTAKSANRVFNVALFAKSSLLDVDVSVKLRSVKGRLDQGGGVVWRAQDGENYYIARFNPLEDNLRLYKVVRGKRRLLRSATVKRSGATWKTLRVVARGALMRCYLNGKVYLQVRDRTLRKAGKVGLWSKADAQTRFDDFRALTLASPPQSTKAQSTKAAR